MINKKQVYGRKTGCDTGNHQLPPAQSREKEMAYHFASQAARHFAQVPRLILWSLINLRWHLQMTATESLRLRWDLMLDTVQLLVRMSFLNPYRGLSKSNVQLRGGALNVFIASVLNAVPSNVVVRLNLGFKPLNKLFAAF